MARMASEKTQVIEYLFRQRYNTETGTIDADKAVVFFDDITVAIDETGADLSKNNPANFWKDLTRKNPELSWPSFVLAIGWTGEDAIGAGNKASFRFVPLPPGQTTAFKKAMEPSDSALERAVTVQSLSIPVATKALGRSDENWVAQVAQRLAVVETHFAVFSARSVVEVNFLQTGIKLRGGEVDAAYSLTDFDGALWLVSVEVKSRSEQLWPAQVRRAALALQATSAATEMGARVIPFGVKIVDTSKIWTVEFEPAETEEEQLEVASEGIIELKPSVPGV
ncbi:hypothetical protein [Blastococcus haudaquaticus]|uniref:hypothetical protein n=1 Tax=Blastococcus haudaquaticus TaxID=1938745 RepID=UPI0011775A34|nr:hypothetical protein [Blastococcus haudaquaticus]